MDKKYFIDICTLFEENYTGISNVNYYVVKYFYENMDNCYFFHNKKIIKKQYINEIIQKKYGGDWLLKIEKNGVLYECNIESKIEDFYSIGIFSHVKYIRDFFDFEVQIIHDITYLLTKEFHNEDTIQYHMQFAMKDFESNDLNVCNSQSTYEDIVTYFDVDPSKCIVDLLGSSTYNLIDEPLYKDILNRYSVEDYILILGTIEPRKNIDIVFKYIEKNPNILDDYKFVFIGRNGWKITFEEKISKLAEKGMNISKIKHFNYVSEEEKNILLMYAKMLIYPSIYEGFGLPVLEALSVGTPVLTTISSSLPEVGSNYSYYFDPFSIESFSDKFNYIIKNLHKIDKRELIEYSKKFTWENFVEVMISEIKNRT
jgi:glycosyltransferase involved in cell wall biosynthesis